MIDSYYRHVTNPNIRYFHDLFSLKVSLACVNAVSACTKLSQELCRRSGKTAALRGNVEALLSWIISWDRDEIA